jgi:plasmid stabilization system protein ParE
MAYQVIISPAASAEIEAQVHYIAFEKQMPETAARWNDRVHRAIATLSYFPLRHEFAPENSYRSYDIRRLIIGNYLALYTIDEAKQTVHVIGFRHGARLPRPNDLPRDEP